MKLLTDAERMSRAKGIRWLALKTLAYYLICLPVTLPLVALRWIGDNAENAFDWIDLPAYRMRSAQEELRRELIRDNRRRAEPAPTVCGIHQDGDGCCHIKCPATPEKDCGLPHWRDEDVG